MIVNLLSSIEEFATKNHVPIITENSRALFANLIKEVKPSNVLEIGTAIGYSTLIIANESFNTLEKITTIELSEERYGVAKNYINQSPYKDKIEILNGDASKLIPTLTRKYDFVFIDAAKGQYPEYWRLIQPILSKSCIVLADNVLFRGYVEDVTASYPRRYKTIVKRLREYISLINNTKGFVSKIFYDGDGLAVSRRYKNVEKT